MDSIWITLLIVCPLIFISAFVDAVAGGGGLISLPAYLLAGLPAHVAMGTNKVVSPTGTLVATISYLKGGKLDVRIALVAAVGAILGATGGTKLILVFPEDVLKLLILIVLPIVAVFLATQKQFGGDDSVKKELPLKKEILFSFMIGLFIGFYDGMVGPGTGTFMIIAFTKVFNLDLVTSSGCAKMANLASNIGSAIVLAMAGKVMWSIVAPAVVCCMVGGRLGSSYAMKGGSKNVRKIIYVVLALLVIKFITELI